MNKNWTGWLLEYIVHFNIFSYISNVGGLSEYGVYDSVFVILLSYQI